MRINKFHYPLIIVLTLLAFIVLGLLLGFAPSHGSGTHGLVLPFRTLSWLVFSQGTAA